jgi:hypothetical protein
VQTPTEFNKKSHSLWWCFLRPPSPQCSPTPSSCACSNFLLYPKEDREARELVYMCRTPRCYDSNGRTHTEAAESPYVFRNQVIKARK